MRRLSRVFGGVEKLGALMLPYAMYHGRLNAKVWMQEVEALGIMKQHGVGVGVGAAPGDGALQSLVVIIRVKPCPYPPP
jgi:hypothetical protein